MNTNKYYDIRNQIQAGDIVLYHGTGVYSKSIQFFDDAHWNHIGIVTKLGYRLITIDMWTRGIELAPLSRRIGVYKEFRVLRPKASADKISSSIEQMINGWERDIHYDYWLLPRIALYKKTGIDLAGLGSRKRKVCSELVQDYTNMLDLSCYKDVKLITPEDFVRKSIDENIELIIA